MAASVTHSVASSGMGAAVAAAKPTLVSPTNVVHRSLCDSCFFGPYASYRKNLDFSYHANYTEERQAVQDALVDGMLKNGVPSKAPWILYTAGAMGVGKSWTTRWLDSKGIFPLRYFAHVDPDAVKCHLPEMPVYIRKDPERAGTLTHKESGFIAEIAEAAALDRSLHVMVDGSLRDASWYRGVFQRIREQHPQYRIAILHVIAAPSKVYARAEKRSTKTGRVVPHAVLQASILSVPRSVAQLAPYADFVAEVNTDGDEPIPLTMEWAEFQSTFAGVVGDAEASGAEGNPDAGNETPMPAAVEAAVAEAEAATLPPHPKRTRVD